MFSKLSIKLRHGRNRMAKWGWDGEVKWRAFFERFGDKVGEFDKGYTLGVSKKVDALGVFVSRTSP